MDDIATRDEDCSRFYETARTVHKSRDHDGTCFSAATLFPSGPPATRKRFVDGPPAKKTNKKERKKERRGGEGEKGKKKRNIAYRVPRIAFRFSVLLRFFFFSLPAAIKPLQFRRQCFCLSSVTRDPGIPYRERERNERREKGELRRCFFFFSPVFFSLLSFLSFFFVCAETRCLSLFTLNASRDYTRSFLRFVFRGDVDIDGTSRFRTASDSNEAEIDAVESTLKRGGLIVS